MTSFPNRILPYDVLSQVPITIHEYNNNNRSVADPGANTFERLSPLNTGSYYKHPDRYVPRKKLEGFRILRDFPLILGIFLCIFRLLQQGRIHFGGVEPGDTHQYADGNVPLLCT